MVFARTGVWKSKRGTALLACRCGFINDEHYGYNARDELISADEVSYAYDNIGNRTTAEGKTYTANTLNQYTAIDDFTPQYDADGNQTLIKTETGIWSVTYNAENRPVRWQSDDTEITMAFDSMGRRVSMRTLTPGFDLLQRFVYKDFLCVRQLRGPDATPYQSYVWDPTEPIATRPLLLRDAASIPFYYYHDGNKTSPASPTPPASPPSPTPTPPTVPPPSSPPPSPSTTPSNSPPKSTTRLSVCRITTTATMIWQRGVGWRVTHLVKIVGRTWSRFAVIPQFCSLIIRDYYLVRLKKSLFLLSRMRMRDNAQH